MNNKVKIWSAAVASAFLLAACSPSDNTQLAQLSPIEYVNPYIGNISHLLVPTYPTIHLPNSMMRVYPERADFTGDRLGGLPLIVTGHRRSSSFNLSPFQGNEKELQPIIPLSYDQENLKPYRYQVYLDEQHVSVDFAPAKQSAVYNLSFEKGDAPAFIVFNSRNGELKWDGKSISGYQHVEAEESDTKVYLYAEVDKAPEKVGALSEGTIQTGKSEVDGINAAIALQFPSQVGNVGIRYGVSFIDEEQARKNLEREIKGFDVDAIAKVARDAWNEALGKIEIKGGTDDDKQVFYTSLYRCFERPVCISEDGRYYSAYDGKVHDDEGSPFYVDDWIWDTYRGAHPLRSLLAADKEGYILNSYLLMAEQMGTNWMPTFPEVTGDSRRMNSNHGVAAIIDAYRKGVTHFDLAKAYDACRKAIEEKTLIPWSGKSAGWLDDFYKEHGYIPALRPGEKETVANVSIWEKRQPVAVTLGTAYDQWCLSQIAQELGKEEEANHYLKCSYNYRNLFNPETHFFHPKDKEGKFIYPWITAMTVDWAHAIITMRTMVMCTVGMSSITLAIWSNWWEATRHFPLR